MSAESIDKPLYDVNGKVLCRAEDGLFYEAKIVRVGRAEDGGLFYKVHYQGWSKTYDESIHESLVETRFLDHTPESLKEAQEAQVARRELERSDRDRRGKRKRKSMNWSRKDTEEEKVSFENGHDKRKESVTSSSCSEELNGSSFFSPRANWSVKIGTPSGSGVEKIEANSDARQEEFFEDNSRCSWINDKLLIILEEDRRLIETECRCPVLPAKVPATKIINEYARYIRQVDKTNKQNFSGEKAQRWKRFVKGLDECIPGFLDYFDVSIEAHVLKDIERLRHRDLVNSGTVNAFELSDIHDKEVSEGLRPSQCYGYIYIVRFLTHFEEILNCWSAGSSTTDSLPIFVRGLLKWLSQVAERYWNVDSDYEQVSDEFRQRLHEVL